MYAFMVWSSAEAGAKQMRPRPHLGLLACRWTALTPSNLVVSRRAVATFGSVSSRQRHRLMHRPGPSAGLWPRARKTRQ